MIRSIKQYDSEAFIKIVCRSDKQRIKLSRQLFELQGIYSSLDYYSKDELQHSFKLLIRNGYKQFDYGFVLQYEDNDGTSAIPSIIVKLAAKITCGIRIKHNTKIKYQYYVDRKDGLRIVDYPNLMLKKVGIPVSESIDYILDKSSVKPYLPTFSYDKNKRNIALVVGTAKVSLKTKNGTLYNSPKNWSYKNWIDLAIKLSDEGFNVFLLGGNKEKHEIKTFMPPDFVKYDIFDFLGKTTILNSLALESISSLVVGADTGLMHCAGALGIKSITLFGCTDYHEYLPFGNQSDFITAKVSCSPCFGTVKAVQCRKYSCMRAITVENVFNHIIKILNH